MADTNVIPFGAAIAGDVLSAFGLPGGNTLVSIAEGYLAKKRKDSAEILIKEISSGRHGGPESAAPLSLPAPADPIIPGPNPFF